MGFFANYFQRAKLVLLNMLMLIPIWIMLFVCAILVSIETGKLGAISDKTDSLNTALGWSIFQTVALWLLSVGNFLFVITIGLFILPIIIGQPYLFGGVLIVFALILFTMSLSFFYATYAVSTTSDYKNGDSNAKSAFTYSIVIAIIILITALMALSYAIWIIYKYRKYGGLTKDLKMSGQVLQKGVEYASGVGEMKDISNLASHATIQQAMKVVQKLKPADQQQQQQPPQN